MLYLIFMFPELRVSRVLNNSLSYSTQAKAIVALICFICIILKERTSIRTFSLETILKSTDL